MRYFLEMQMMFYRDLIKGNGASDHAWYQSMLQAYHEKNDRYDQLLEVLLETRDKLWKSVNLSLLCDQMVYKMKEVLG